MAILRQCNLVKKNERHGYERRAMKKRGKCVALMCIYVFHTFHISKCIIDDGNLVSAFWDLTSYHGREQEDCRWGSIVYIRQVILV